MNQFRRKTLCILLFVCMTAAALQIGAVVEPHDNHLTDKEFQHATLSFEDAAHSLVTAKAETAANAADALAAMGIISEGARVDARGGRLETALPSIPMVAPSKALGESNEQRAAAVRSAFTTFLNAHSAALSVNPRELGHGKITVHDDGKIVQVYLPREIGGIPVRGSYIGAVINHGKMNLFGINRWGDVDIALEPALSWQEAEAVAAAHMAPHVFASTWSKPQLILLPTDLGERYGHRLAWAIHPRLKGELATFELMVDAHSGELLSARDTNVHAEAKGGVYPITNDQVAPDGVEQPGWPMPFMNIGSTTTDTGGNYTPAGGETASLSGTYVNMNDNCGNSSLTGSNGIDWGTSGGDDCTTPGFGGAGNTHSSRSGFYEINRTVEMARSQLPSNSWLQQQLTSNMNINQSCNAFWNGSTINFYRSGGGCANTGEIAGVFVHEWGHGMDDNDAVPTIASPSGEGIADIYTALRLDTSCIGRNFLANPCGGYGDPCISCTGVRDIDYQQRQSGQIHGYTWAQANCGSSVHCNGGVYAEAVYNLWKRNLQQAPYNYDNNTAHEIVNRLTFIGAGNVGTWFSGGPPFGGCGSSGGYLQYLAADDDNGNLNDGTPHMQAIFDAFNFSEIACNTPTVQDSGCAGTPTGVPNVTATSGDTQVSLSWNAIAGTTEYEIFRAEGIFQCNFGKVRIGSTTGTTFTDVGLQNGRDYSYVVIPKGPSDSCFGNASSCDTVQPGQVACSVDADCDDGVFCNGAETCSGGFCAAGSAPCPETWTCDEGADACIPECSVDADCDDGSFCNGAETCNAGTCGGGVDPCPGQSCDEGNDICTVTNGPQNAVYNGSLGAPECAIRGSSCDSTTLVDSRNNLSPAEPNQPNTLDGCADGTAGSYHSDESNDRIVVSTLDGLDFTEGKTVQVDATVWAWSTGSSDTLDVFYAADANNPSWTLIGSVVPPSGGAHTLSVQYVLPAGDLQAVRAQFRYTSTNAPCSAGTYNDRDDLVFAVGGSAPACVVDADCSDGLFCNGDEVCNAGTCEAGTAPTCDDGQFCNGTETCNESTDSCDAGTAPTCDDGQFCNGTETCNESTDSCDAGTAPTCDDGQFCNGAETCNEATDSCDAGAPPACDDGQFCNGTETCNEGTDSCDAGTPPVCDDGDFCNGTETCNEGTDSCDSGTAPCDPGTETCNEGTDTCEPIGCTSDAQCDDGAFCNGAETCNLGTGSCEAGTPPVCDDGQFCNGTETCNESTDSCDAGTAPTCDDGQFCNGTETCNEGTDSCDAGTPPVCDDGLFCNGTETCNEGTDSCDSGSDPCGAGETCDEGTDTCEGGGGNPTLYMSFRSTTAVPGVGNVADEDVVSYDQVAGTWALVFDGSDVGLGSFEIDGLAILSDGDLLLSFRQTGTVGGVSADDSDIVRFTPTSLGSTTAGAFALYFDASDVGLTSNGEDVDAITLDGSGNLLVSTQGGFSGTGASGADEDLFLFTGSLGPNTSGSFSQYFDGSDVGFGGNSAEDVDGASLTAAGTLLFSTVGTFSVTGATGADEDVGEFTGTFGSATSGSSSLLLDLSALGIATSEDIGSLHIEE